MAFSGPDLERIEAMHRKTALIHFLTKVDTFTWLLRIIFHGMLRLCRFRFYHGLRGLGEDRWFWLGFPYVGIIDVEKKEKKGRGRGDV